MVSVTGQPLVGKPFSATALWWLVVAVQEYREAAPQSTSDRRVRRPRASRHPEQRPRGFHAVLGPLLFGWHQRHTAVGAAGFPPEHLFLFGNPMAAHGGFAGAQECF